MAIVGTLNANNKYNSYKSMIENVYFKIENLIFDFSRDRVSVPVRGYLSEYARHNQGIGIFKRVFYIPVDYFSDTLTVKNELLKRAYEYIMKLPEFKGFKIALNDYDGKIEITKDQVEKETKELEDLINELRG